MHSRTAVLLCIALTVLLSLPLIKQLPLTRELMESDVRSRAPQAVESLQRRGVWVVNVELQDIEVREDDVCFHWEERYRSRTEIADPKPITTCL